MDWLTRLAEESNLEQAVSDCYTAALDAGDSQLWVPRPKLLAALRTLPLACQSALTAALATVLPGATVVRWSAARLWLRGQ